MEGQPAKRRRVYSLELNKVGQAAFARNYLNYLVPALTKIKEKSTSSSQHISHCDIQNVVKYEVDMAMVFSAPGFAWSNALSVKLQTDYNKVNVGSGTTTSFDENNKVGGEGSSRSICDQNERLALDYFSSKPSNFKSKYYNKDTPKKKKGLKGEDHEDEVIDDQMKRLSRLIPGGEEMCNEQMVAELQTYISCVQMQVNILQCLTETHD